MSVAYPEVQAQLSRRRLEEYRSGEVIKTPQGNIRLNGIAATENSRQLWLEGHYDQAAVLQLLAFMTGAEHFTKEVIVHLERNPHTQEPQTSVLVQGLLVYYDH